MSSEEKIRVLEKFIRLIKQIKYIFPRTVIVDEDIRQDINRLVTEVRLIVIEARAMRTYTIGPPPAVGGLVMENIDPFDCLFNPPYGDSMVPNIIDMINIAIGNINSGVLEQAQPEHGRKKYTVREKYAFVAMAINPDVPELDDVLDAIKEACKDLGIDAERVDDQNSSEKITTRIIESIQAAEFVIVDLTHSKPNVYYEAGYAEGLGKLPIYIAKGGTRLEFDIKDYPVIFFASLRELKTKLKSRLSETAAELHS